MDSSSKKLTVSNTDPKYSTKTFSTDPDQAVDTASLHWTNYVMCGYKGVFDFLRESNKTIPSEVGLQIIVDGRVPTGSGLSSSSALTCATAVAVMAAHNLSFTKVEIAEFTCKCERHCGTQSGGMDQVSTNTSQYTHFLLFVLCIASANTLQFTRFLLLCLAVCTISLLPIQHRLISLSPHRRRLASWGRLGLPNWLTSTPCTPQT